MQEGPDRAFAAPAWLRESGIVAWLLVGIVLIVAGAVWLMALTSTIVIPVITATLVASVASPVVGWLQHRRVPRAVGAALVLVGLVALGLGVGEAVISGITSQAADISGHLSDATDKLADALNSLGADHQTATSAAADAQGSTNSAGKVLLNGVSSGISALSSLAAFVAFTVLSLFFLLKDGPSLRRWAEEHMGVSEFEAQTITGDTLRALRGYFGGVAAVALFNAVVIGVGALIIGVPLALTLAIVTFVGAFIPFAGAWVAGIFAVLVALGAQGTDAALAMGIVVLLANGALQQLVQPLAYGAALSLHPLVVLVVTIGAGSLFGMIGLVLGAPLTSAIVRINRDLAAARSAAEPAPG